jgi:predicted HTH domain antitoxin
MTMITFDLPDGAFSALRKDPREMESELRLAAAAKWYELGLVSQERGAEIAGVTRVEFMHALSRLNVSPFQEDLDEDPSRRG